MIAGGSFPLFARNLGTDESLAVAVTVKPATHTIAHGVGGVSSLVLPVAS